MSLEEVVTSFTTGTYVVTRTTSGGYDNDGKAVAGTASILNLSASIQPVSGRDLKNLPEAQRGDELRVVYCLTELKTRSPGFKADVFTIDGESWEVVRVEKFSILSSHYRALIARRSVP